MKNISGDHLKLVFGLKLKHLRQEKGLSLKDLAAKTQLSISYLSEIEGGKKYPKPEKLLALSSALGTPFDELVSLNVGRNLNPLRGLLDSPLIREFPFHMFGINIHNVIELATTSPQKSGALVATLSEFTRSYDMRLEHFLFAALRSYQKYHLNFFKDIEDEVSTFRGSSKLLLKPPFDLSKLIQLTQTMGCEVDEESLQKYPELMDLRSVFVESCPPRLLMNPKLLPSQKAFILGREIGHRVLNLNHRAKTSSWLQVSSFDQVLDNFKASYFSGALLIDKDLLISDLQRFFKQKKWNPFDLQKIMLKYQVTPEMFLYRLSQVIPHAFGIKDLYYLRFSDTHGSVKYQLTKELNMSSLAMPSGINLHENYCRRWLAIRQLEEAFSHPNPEVDQVPTHGSISSELKIEAQRSRFIDQDLHVFNISMARPLSLNSTTHSSMTLGFIINEDFKRLVRFWEDPEIEDIDVNETCERCCLSRSECQSRAAEPDMYQKQERLKKREQTLSRLLLDLGETQP